MANTRAKGQVLGGQLVEDELLPLAIRTIVINGKQLSPAIYKQLTEADLIDEWTGELRGIPFGYFHIHGKTCPEAPHKHVLWGSERVLHLATIVSRDRDARYQHQEALSLKKQDDLMHLLTILLVLADHSFTLKWLSGDEREISIAEYTLYLSADAARPFARLDEIRAQYKEDFLAWQSEQQRGQEDPQATEEEQRVAARALMAQFAEQGGEIIHPALHELKADQTSPYGYYTSRDLEALGWHPYPREASGERRQPALIYWRSKNHFRDLANEEPLRTLIESHFAAQISIQFFRVFLAQLRMETEKQAIEKEALKLVQTGIIPLKKTQKTAGAQAKTLPADLHPDRVWQAYQRERERFKAYTQRWDTQLEEIQKAEQLFLLS